LGSGAKEEVGVMSAAEYIRRLRRSVLAWTREADERLGEARKRRRLRHENWFPLKIRKLDGL